MRPGPVKATRNDHRQNSWGLELFHLVISTTSICQRTIYAIKGWKFLRGSYPIALKDGPHQIRNEKFQGTFLLRDRRGYPVNLKKYSIRYDFTYPIKMGSNSRFFWLLLLKTRYILLLLNCVITISCMAHYRRLLLIYHQRLFQISMILPSAKIVLGPICH